MSGLTEIVHTPRCTTSGMKMLAEVAHRQLEETHERFRVRDMEFLQMTSPIEYLLYFREAKITGGIIGVLSVISMIRTAEEMLAFPRALPIELKGVAV